MRHFPRNEFIAKLIIFACTILDKLNTSEQYRQYNPWNNIIAYVKTLSIITIELTIKIVISIASPPGTYRSYAGKDFETYFNLKLIILSNIALQ
jgi:hypothetical protein